MGISTADFGTTRRGQPARVFTLEAGPFQVALSDYGATLLSWLVPAEGGGREDILLGHDRLDELEVSEAFFGATVGRYANRIARGRFAIDGRGYELATNNGPNHLHGGLVGFDKKIWKAESFQSGQSVGIAFSLESPDGDEGYPGTVQVKATYTLGPGGDLDLAFEARTDAPTAFGLTQHAYFNLAGNGRGDILDHELMLRASRYLPVTEELIPTGELRAVAGGPFDFTRPKAVGRDIVAAGGYDHCFVVDREDLGDGLFVECADLRHPASGRRLRVSTTLPGVQLYTANFLAGTRGHGGKVYPKHAGLCLETEVFPDSPNHPEFPGSVLRPGQVWRHKTRYSFDFPG